MAVTRLKRKERKNKTISRLKQQHIKLNKRVILIKSPNKSGVDTDSTAALPVNEASAAPKKSTAAAAAVEQTETMEASAAPKKRAANPNADTQVESASAPDNDVIDEVGGKNENTSVE